MTFHAKEQNASGRQPLPPDGNATSATGRPAGVSVITERLTEMLSWNTFHILVEADGF
jgi:hypothetical protein